MKKIYKNGLKITMATVVIVSMYISRFLVEQYGEHVRAVIMALCTMVLLVASLGLFYKRMNFQAIAVLVIVTIPFGVITIGFYLRNGYIVTIGVISIFILFGIMMLIKKYFDNI